MPTGRTGFPFLTPGIYDVRSELQGFKAVEQRAVTVSLGQTTTVNMQLEVGGLTEVVQVTGTSRSWTRRRRPAARC